MLAFTFGNCPGEGHGWTSELLEQLFFRSIVYESGNEAMIDQYDQSEPEMIKKRTLIL